MNTLVYPAVEGGTGLAQWVRMNCRNQAFFSAILAFSGAAQASLPPAAATGLNLGAAAIGGSGCVAKAAELKTAGVGPDSTDSEIRVLFQNFKVKADGGRGLDRKNCSIAMPFKVPSGFKLVVKKAEFRAKLNLSPGSEGTLEIETHRSGEKGRLYSKVWEPSTKPQDVLHRKFMSDLFESRCGENLLLRLDTSLRLKRGATGDATGTLAKSDLTEFVAGEDAASDGAALILDTSLVACDAGA